MIERGLYVYHWKLMAHEKMANHSKPFLDDQNFWSDYDSKIISEDLIVNYNSKSLGMIELVLYVNDWKLLVYPESADHSNLFVTIQNFDWATIENHWDRFWDKILFKTIGIDSSENWQFHIMIKNHLNTKKCMILTYDSKSLESVEILKISIVSQQGISTRDSK